MELYSVFVTGANRGIGLEFVRQLVKLPKPPKLVFATYRSRDSVEALKKIRDSCNTTQVLLIKMDVSKKNEIAAARKIVEDMVGSNGLTLLINNAGVFAEQRFPEITEENLLYHFKTNTIGPVMVTQEFLPLLQSASAKYSHKSSMSVNIAAVLNISSLLGSIEEVTKLEVGGSTLGYNISKAALNMMGRIMAASVKEQGILVINLCPGAVKTDMSGERGIIELNDSVSAILRTLPTLNESHHGSFIDRNGYTYKF